MTTDEQVHDPTVARLPKTIRAAMLHVIALAQYSLACADGQLARCQTRRSRTRAEHDRLQQELALVREEQRINYARMSRLAPQKRPHYPPTERMAKCGAKFTLQTCFHAGRKQPPVVKLRTAAQRQMSAHDAASVAVRAHNRFNQSD